jgi:Family of unknown function (DUF5329)
MPQRFPVVAALLISAFSAHADPLAPTAKAELAAVLDRLEASGCQFNRNGTWHSGAEARAHPRKKFDHVEKRTSARSPEEYIELAASKSSTTGVAYLVRCNGRAPVASSTWLLQQLRDVRRP